MPSSIIDDVPPFSTLDTVGVPPHDYWVDNAGRRIGVALPLQQRIKNLEKRNWMNSHYLLSNIMGEDLLILNSWDVEETECKHEECGWYCKEKRI